MSRLYDGNKVINAGEWLEKNRPDNGVFKVYWTEDGEGVSLEDTGFGLRYEWEYKDGERVDGISKGWNQDGNLIHTANYKDGQRDGLETWWYKNGQKSSEKTYKDRKEDGLWTDWYENGQKSNEQTFKDEKFDGLRTRWDKNGQKKSEENYKDGKRNGLFTHWYENGQKEREHNYKDDELISEKQWNMEGDEI